MAPPGAPDSLPDRRRRGPRSSSADPRRLRPLIGRDDLAALTGARHAGRANLSSTIDHRRPSVSPRRPAGLSRSVDRHEDRMAHLAADRLGQMALAAHVLDKDHFAGADLPRLTVARGDLHATVQVDDVLPARRRMPTQVILATGLAENDARGRQALRQLAAVAFLDPLDFDIAPMGFAGVVNVNVMDSHCLTLPLRSARKSNAAFGC